jgi:hypothetical protein
MADSFEQAQLQVQDLKEELFEAFQPTAQLFAPIQSEFFDFVPGQMERISRSMEGLTEYEDSLFDLFRGGTKFAADFIDVIVENEETVSSLTKTFAGLIGNQIISGFQWLLDSADKNQDMLISLGSILKTVGMAIYQVFMMVSRAVVMLKPFFGILSWISKLFNNSLVSGIVAVIAVMYGVITVISYLKASLLSLSMTMLTSMGPAMASLITWMGSYIGGALTMIGVNTALAASIGRVTAAVLTLAGATGIGLLLSAGGMALAQGMKPDTQKKDLPGTTTPSGAGRSGPDSKTGGKTVNNFKVIGDPDDSQLKAMGDVADSSVKETNYVNETRSTPSFDDV